MYGLRSLVARVSRSRRRRASRFPLAAAPRPPAAALEALEQRLLLAGDIVVGINPLATNDTTPALTGTVDDPAASVVVRVQGQNYDATNNGDGTWTLADNTIAPALAEGTYDVLALAIDAGAGTFGLDDTADELVIDLTAPDNVTVNPVGPTNVVSPELTGTVDDAAATVSVNVNGADYAATNNGDGTWTLADNTIAPALAEGTYDVLALAIDAGAGTFGLDDTADELVIDLTAPDNVTVNPVGPTNVVSPELTGTVDDAAATVSVNVNGADYAATNNGDGTWTLAAGTIADLPEGTYDVAVTATDAAGNTGNDATTDELVIDLTAPAVTVDALATGSRSPQLTGTVDDPAATVSVNVDGSDYAATNNGDGTWTLAAGQIADLADGTYDVAVTATDTAGNPGTDGTTDELAVDAAPAVTVDSLTTNVVSPQLTGTVDDPAAAVSVNVNGADYAATNNGDGTWTLPAGTIADLSEGTYDVTVTATDGTGHVGTDTTTDELVIDLTAPVPTVDALTTNVASPSLTGTVDDPAAAVSVNVNGADYAATNNGNGTWTLPPGQIAALPDGTYDVAVTATDAAGNTGNDATTDELVIDVTAPAVTVDSLVADVHSPQLTGTVDDPDATISVNVNGVDYAATNNGDGTWTLAAGQIAWLPNGTYDVTVTGTDAPGNAGTDATVDELTVDAAPTVTINPLATKVVSPQLTGTVDDPAAAISVHINGADYAAVNNGNGTWTLAAGTIAALPDGTYDAVVTATDLNGNTGTDATTNEVTIDATAPAVTVDPLTTTYTSPRLTGTVSDPTATVSVRVNGSSYSAVNNGDGTWTLAAGTITSLAVGTYDVAVTATDAVGNAGQDATLDELRVRAQTTMVLNFYGLWSVHYTDSDGTKVRVILNTLRKVPGGITLYFDSNSLITMRTDQRGRHAWIECDAGAELAALVVSQYSRGVSIKTSGGTVSGALLGGVSGEANLRVLSAPTVTLVGDGVYMPGSAIASVKLAAITDTTVTMFGLLTGGVTFKIGQSVSGSDIEVTDGDVSSFIVGSMVDSSLRVGTLGARDLNGDGVADLPSLDDFRSSHRIRRFTVTGYRGAAAPLFVNSNIAAEDLGAITLRDAQLNNQPDTVHEPFGLVGRSLRSLTLKQGVVTYRWLNGAWTPALDPLDLEIRLP